MPLITIKSNLTNLKYGNDRPLGGSSKQPYIQFTLPSQFATDETISTSVFFSSKYANLNPGQLVSKDFLEYYKSNENGVDFPIRGGKIDFSIGTQTFTISSKIDKERIKKFFESKPRGAAFLKKQIGLNLTNPKIETGNSFQVVPGSNLIPGLLENTRIYNNGINTLTQVGVQGTGTHLPRQGVFPLDYASKYYKDIVGAQSLLNSTEVVKINRLLILQNLKLSASSTSANLGNINQINKLGISLNKNTLFKYLGGPGSVYGVGSTTIKRVVDTSQAANKYTKIMGTVSMTYDNLLNQKLNDFDRITGKKTKYIQDYVDPGTKIQSREETYNLTMYNESDRMSALSSFMFNNEKAPWQINDKDTKDIIKFVFEAIENNNPVQSWAIFFRAMLSGFTDSHQASINSFKYQGRGEDFYTYQGVSRAISFGFKIAVQSRKELKPLYTKLNHLISQVYPDYSPTYGVMRAPMIRLTIGDYLHRVAGMLENVNITVDDNAPWEINFENSPDVKQLPQVINVQCSFKPIQDFVPRRENMYNTNIPFIGEQLDSENKDYLSILGGFRIDADTLQANAISPMVSLEEEAMRPVEETATRIDRKLPKYSQNIKINPFESKLEKDRRTGNFFEVFRSDRG